MFPKLNVICPILLLTLSVMLPSSAYPQDSDPLKRVTKSAALDKEQALLKQLERAGANRDELERALKMAPKNHLEAIEFLVLNMPKKDLESLSSKFLLDHVKGIYRGREQSPWKDAVSDELFFSDVLPYANVDETREFWVDEMHERCWPIVKDCSTPGEAAQELNKHLYQLVGVKYSTKRKKANQCPSESIEQGLASCTGLSILLVDACRSVNVPARLAGIPSWVNKNGNHTWVEVWTDGDWHFTGAAEYNPEGLDRVWFANDAALADKSKKMNSIYAVSFAKTETPFPLVWSRDGDNRIYAINVTDRYTRKEPTKLASGKVRVRFRIWNQDKTARVATNVVVVPVKLPTLPDPTAEDPQQCTDDKFSGVSKPHSADMNDMLEFVLDQDREYECLIGLQPAAKSHRFKTNLDETQLLEFVVD